MQHTSIGLSAKVVLSPLVGILVLLVVAGCNVLDSNRENTGAIAQLQWDKLYLRGVFNWWEADARYKLTKNAEHHYSATIDLVADGQPYEFRFSDQDWSLGTNCGYLAQDRDQVLNLNTIVQADCNTHIKNFKFTPVLSGSYTFHFVALPNQVPHVFVTKAQTAG